MRTSDRRRSGRPRETTLCQVEWHVYPRAVVSVSLDYKHPLLFRYRIALTTSVVFLFIDLLELTRTRVSHPSYPNIDSTEAISKQLIRKKKFLAFISLFLIPILWRNSHRSSFKRDCVDQMNFPYHQAVHRETLLISNPIQAQPHDITEIVLKVVLVIYINSCIKTKIMI
jgi:hypothetical protein